MGRLPAAFRRLGRNVIGRSDPSGSDRRPLPDPAESTPRVDDGGHAVAFCAYRSPGAGAGFSLDMPQFGDGGPYEVDSPLATAGWVIPPPGRKVQSIEFRIGREVVARARIRIRRAGVEQAFPNHPGALWSGFDAEVPLDRWIGRTTDLLLVACWDVGQEVLTPIPLEARGRIGEQPRRARSFDLLSLLACPSCGSSSPARLPDALRCGACGATFEVRRGTPHFTDASAPAPSRLLEPCFTHPYGAAAVAIIDQHARGVVLDFGAGNTAPGQFRPNVVLHEALHYPQVDVVSMLPRLPYCDNAFDAIISQAVFEHIPRPWEVAQELFRVLKPGGRIHVDTAFMQPFHADPSHYFNMTPSGLREIFRPFRELEVGIKPYQAPSFGLRMQCDVMLQHLRPGLWHDRILKFRADLDRDEFDAELDELGQRYLAAGVFFDGVKP